MGPAVTALNPAAHDISKEIAEIHAITPVITPPQLAGGLGQGLAGVLENAGAEHG
jgi:hypothetical protein